MLLGRWWPGKANVVERRLGMAPFGVEPPPREAEHPLAMARYAGTSVVDLTRIQPTAAVLVDLAREL